MGVKRSVKAALNALGLPPIYACRAWINFDGTGTPAIRASGNISSITDITAGRYKLNFTQNMPDANFAVAGASGSATAANYNIGAFDYLVDGVTIDNWSTSNSISDQPNISAFIIR